MKKRIAVLLWDAERIKRLIFLYKANAGTTVKPTSLLDIRGLRGYISPISAGGLPSAPAGFGLRVFLFLWRIMPERAAFYVDGFNLYHAIEDMELNHLKWLDMRALGRLLIPKQTQELVRIVWCTAIRTDDVQKMLRHREYIRALEGTGVTCLQGHFAKEDRECRSCGSVWKAPVEKQGDVNLAIAMIDDAYRDVFDHAYLLTSDSDQAATVRLLKERFPTKRVTTVCAPGRSHCKEILEITPLKIALSQTHLERCLFPKHLIVDGKPIAKRHGTYDPPKGWKAPEETGA